MLEIDLAYCTAVNFAMLQNHVPIIRKLLIKNEIEEAIDNVKITIWFTRHLTDLAERVIDRIPKETTVEI